MKGQPDNGFPVLKQLGDSIPLDHGRDNHVVLLFRIIGSILIRNYPENIRKLLYKSDAWFSCGNAA
jgi:hypothetical protein